MRSLYTYEMIANRRTAVYRDLATNMIVLSCEERYDTHQLARRDCLISSKLETNLELARDDVTGRLDSSDFSLNMPPKSFMAEILYAHLPPIAIDDEVRQFSHIGSGTADAVVPDEGSEHIEFDGGATWESTKDLLLVERMRVMTDILMMIGQDVVPMTFNAR